MTASASRMSNREDPRLEAAQKRLRGSVGRADKLEAIREIVTNLLGCEEIGLFTVDQANSGLYWSFGIDPKQHETLEGFEESGMRRVMQGECHVEQTGEGPGHHARRPRRVFVPIRSNGCTVAVLVMLKLLPQKMDFDEADINLVKLLSDEAGRGLFDGDANGNG